MDNSEKNFVKEMTSENNTSLYFICECIKNTGAIRRVLTRNFTDNIAEFKGWDIIDRNVRLIIERISTCDFYFKYETAQKILNDIYKLKGELLNDIDTKTYVYKVVEITLEIKARFKALENTRFL